LSPEKTGEAKNLTSMILFYFFIVAISSPPIPQVREIIAGGAAA